MNAKEIKIVLSKQDVQALRTADDICFRHRDGNTRIEAIKRGNKEDPFSQDVRHYIYTDHRLNDYDYKGQQYKNFYAFEMLHYSNHCARWQTIASLLKPLDRLIVNWIKDNNNQLLEEANLHRDEIELIVDRKLKTKTKSMTFRVKTSICANNTARTIKREPL